MRRLLRASSFAALACIHEQRIEIAQVQAHLQAQRTFVGPPQEPLLMKAHFGERRLDVACAVMDAVGAIGKAAARRIQVRERRHDRRG